MRGINKVFLLGNVGADPEIRATSGGSRVATVSLATNRSWKDRQGNKVEATDWHRLTFWGKLADIVEQYVRKGDAIHVEGRISYSTTEDAQGVKRYFTDIVVDQLVMLGSPSSGGSQQGGGQAASVGRGEYGTPQPTTTPGPVSGYGPDDDLPF